MIGLQGGASLHGSGDDGRNRPVLSDDLFQGMGRTLLRGAYMTPLTSDDWRLELRRTSRNSMLQGTVAYWLTHRESSPGRVSCSGPRPVDEQSFLRVEHPVPDTALKAMPAAVILTFHRCGEQSRTHFRIQGTICGARNRRHWFVRTSQRFGGGEIQRGNGRLRRKSVELVEIHMAETCQANAGKNANGMLLLGDEAGIRRL